jgi:SAM-dependent methyltransferase
MRFWPRLFRREDASKSGRRADLLVRLAAHSSRDLDVEAASALPPGADHYRAYVGPPDRYDFISASQFALLFACGLRDRHRVLDFGCGSLRLGRLLIPFLRSDRYFGIDPNRWLIEEGFARELGGSIAAIKNPRFDHNADFCCDVFDTRFDFVVAQSILTHCGPDIGERLIGEMSKVLAPGGKILFTIFEASDRNALPDRMGWIYPGCISYGAAQIERLCQGAGLHLRRLPWHHPEAVWYAAARTPADLPQPDELPLLRGAVLFDPQFKDSLLPEKAPA